ncbi:ATP-dependent helicase [Priestia megaterium]|uniref:ATP-dependent helicase n=1 Tax=Priestia megaterium TaxID=1404 RepID=UPI002079FCFD|nr:ATP-dependent DNA helicase [Priestia megaterium]USL27987.1 ATP-dependent helicase [Priestia megaterium]
MESNEKLIYGDGQLFNLGRATNAQKEAITSVNGPVLISAGPGTGKTFTLVQRIIYMIEELGIDPNHIFVATFTNKAAKELLTRISNELMSRNIKNINVNEMYIGTFHSLCYRIIRDNIEYSELNKNLIMMDAFDQQYFIYNHLQSDFEKIENIETILGERGVWKKAEILCTLFNGLTEEIIGPKRMIQLDSLQIKALGEAFQIYRRLLKGSNRIDFSSIQSHCLGLLRNEPKLLQKYQEQFVYMMIDEYQDTNYIQEQLIFKLSKTNNICVVGDDDQALYRFRGATIRNILEFKNKFPKGECKEIKLVENFRSVPDIVDFYNKWMHETETDSFPPFKWDKFRLEKTIIPHKKKEIEAPAVLRVSERTEEKWHQKVLQTIRNLEGSILDYNQIAFLFNSVKSEEAKNLANFLEKNGVGVYSPRSNMFFERKEIRQMVGMLLLLFPNYCSDFQLGKHTEWLQSELESYYTECVGDALKLIRENYNLSKWLKANQERHKHLEENLDYAFSGLFYELFQFDEFKFYMDTSLDKGISDQRPIRNMAIFSKLLAKFEYNHRISVFTHKNFQWVQTQFFNNFLRFLFSGGIEEYQDESEYAPKGCVSFLTIHQSKGMEFPVVFVGSLKRSPIKNTNPILERVKKYFSNRESFEPEEQIKIFDFWRLYYVAFSRAQDLLILACAEKEGRPGPAAQGRIPSIYFKPYYNSLIEYDSTQIDFNEYKFSLVKNADLKETYAFTTDISAYERCAMQYKMYRILGFSPVRDASTMFGSLVHETIEDVHRAVLRNEIDSITDKQIDVWFDENYKGLVDRQNSYLQPRTLETAKGQVKKYVDTHRDKWSHIQEAEVELSIIEPNFILKGQIDLLKTDGNDVEIMDFKAERKPTPEMLGQVEYDKKISQYRKQLQVYAYLIEQKYGVDVKRMRLYYTNEKEIDPYITFEKDNAEVDKVVNEFTSVVEHIQSKNFNQRTSNVHICRDCDMRFYCNRAK